MFDRFYWSLFLLWRTHGQARLPYRPRAQLAAAGAANLRRMVRHACETVPYYRRAFAERRLRPEEIRGAADLALLPLIGKAELRAAPDDFLSTRIRPERRYELRTSGSTGTPVPVWYDHAALMSNVVYGERERTVLAHLVGRAYGYRQASILYPGAPARAVWAFYRQKAIVPTGVRPQRLILSTADPIETNLARLNEFRPDVLFGFGSYLEVFFRHLAVERPAFHRPKVVLYGAAHFSETARRFVEEELQIPVIGLYNACEAMQLGFMCEARRGFHVHEDLCPVRIVDEAGRALPPGQPGEVVITNLVNRATVLLNYRLGDRAVWLEEPCPCGRTLPRLELLAGRAEDFLRLADGRLVDPRQVWAVLRGQRAIFQYQLTQETWNSFRLRLVAAGDAAELEPKLRTALTNLLGPQASIVVEFVETIPTPARGKLRAVQSLLQEAVSP